LNSEKASEILANALKILGDGLKLQKY